MPNALPATSQTHTYVWDGNNIVRERIAFADGSPRLARRPGPPDSADSANSA